MDFCVCHHIDYEFAKKTLSHSVATDTHLFKKISRRILRTLLSFLGKVELQQKSTLTVTDDWGLADLDNLQMHGFLEKVGVVLS